MNRQSAVEFPGNCRIHIALAVRNLTQSRRFYGTLFGESPTKERPGYVKFEPLDPSVNLTLNEVRDPQSIPQSTAHYGVQVKTAQAVRDAVARLGSAGYETALEEETTCCYAVQDKVWVTDPDGNRWEVFVVTDSEASEHEDASSTCCVTDERPGSCC